MTELNRLRIYKVPAHIMQDIENIYKNIGIEKRSFFKPRIKALIEKHNVKSNDTKINYETMSVSGIPEKTLQELQVIADHIGIDVSSLLKVELYLITKEFPQHMKKPPLNY